MSFSSVDTGSAGSGLSGPWVSFHLRDGKYSAGTYTIRRKPDRDAQAEVVAFTGFQTAVMIDGDTLKTGYVKRAMGEMPERHWNASIARMEEPPTNEKNKFGKSAWSQNFAIRGAWKNEHGEFEAFTWECSGAIEWNAFTRLINGPIKAQARENADKCAVIRVSSIEQISTAGGGLPAPVFELVKWAPRPAVLVSDTPYDADLPEAADDFRPSQPAPRPSGSTNKSGVYRPERPSQAALQAAHAAQSPTLQAPKPQSPTAEFINDEIPF